MNALAVCVVVVLTALPGGAPAPGGPAWGVLDSACTADRTAANRGAGLTMVVVEAHWDRFAPSPGTVDPADVAELNGRSATCVGAGMRVVLGSGVQYPPGWVRQLPGATLRDQRGDAPVTGQVDAVFAAAVRSAQADYLRLLVAELPLAYVEAVLLGTSAAGELGYPDGSDAGRGAVDSWWAFGSAPQTGRRLAAGQTRSPLPGWVPGQPTWLGRPVTAADALRWYRWYSGALVQTVRFQADILRGAGYGGMVHVPAAGRGVLPADLAAATAARLDGTANRDDSLACGLDYVDQFPALARTVPGVVIDLTSVDDASAVAARALNPPQDRCALDDAATSVDPATPVRLWSRLRFARAQVARAGLPAVGENPGPPALETGGAPGSDSEAEQIARSPGYARTCGLAAFLLAFEYDLYTCPGSTSGTTSTPSASHTHPGPPTSALPSPASHTHPGPPTSALPSPANVATMYAITVSAPGGPSNMRWTEVPEPVAGPGEVLLDVVASAVNRADLQQRQGNYPPPPGASEILGLECSGRVAALGEGVDGWAVGDQVCALLAGGGYAQQVAVPAAQLMPIPPGVDLVTAAGLPEVACTVWSNIVMAGRLASGETFLVQGGSSGIGTHAIQVAAALGARVAATAGAPDRLERCRELGADIVIDYHDDVPAELKKATDGHGADVILDNMGAKGLAANLDALARDGRLVIIGLQGGAKAELDIGALLRKRGSVTAMGLRGRPVDGPHGKGAVVAEVTANVWPMIADGRVRPIVHARLPMQQAADAHTQLEAGGVIGKLLLTAPTT